MVEVIWLGMIETILQIAPRVSRTFPMSGSPIFGLVTSVSILLVAVGVFYVLIKLGGFIDSLKEKAESGSVKK